MGEPATGSGLTHLLEISLELGVGFFGLPQLAMGSAQLLLQLAHLATQHCQALPQLAHLGSLPLQRLLQFCSAPTGVPTRAQAISKGLGGQRKWGGTNPEIRGYHDSEKTLRES